MALIESTMGGSLGGQHRIRQQIDVVTQDIGGNRTLIQYSAWLERVVGGSRVWNYDPTPGVTNINGYAPGRSINGYDSRTAGQRWYMAFQEQYWIGHDGAGNANPFFRADYDARNSPYLTSGWCQGNVGLPHINRNANIDGFSFDGITDSHIRFNWHSDANVDYISWWSPAYDGGGHHDIPAGGQGWFSIDLNNLKSNKQYDVYVAVRRADSGIWTQAGPFYATTARQDRFFDLGGM